MQNKYEAGVYIQYWQEMIQKADGSNKPSWFCWAFVADDTDFPAWMDRSCPTAEYTFRFNSGNPMYTVNITDEKEAMLFKLTWVK